MNKCIYTARIAQVAESLLQACYLVEGDRGGREPGRIGAGSGRRRSGMRESCEGERQEKNERH